MSLSKRLNDEVGEVLDRFGDLESRYSGKVWCHCGNDDWREFLYVESGSQIVIACKHCGNTECEVEL